MRAAPEADVSDGLLDVITVREGSKLSFIRVMLLAGRGKHTRLDQVGTAQAASVTVRADRDLRAGADGEPLTVRPRSPRARRCGSERFPERSAWSVGEPSAR